MKFFRLKDAPLRYDDIVFRESRLHKLIGLLLGLAFCGGILALAIHERSWGLGAVALLTALFPLMIGSQMRHALHADNWLVRCRHEGLLVKFRSYLNDQYPDADVVVFELRPDEIAWAACTRETILKPGSERGETTKEWTTSIDIKPKIDDLAELEARLKEERTRPAAGRWVQSKCHDYPVRVMEDGVIRITWRSSSNWITPAAGRALKIMAEVMRTEIRPEQKLFKDLGSDPGEIAERERMILELAERGDAIAAVKLVRKLYGYSLAEARQFVDELMGKAGAGTDRTNQQ